MIKPLHLGNQTFPVNIIQGPLAGISCAPFRRLVWQFGRPAFSCTEMISANTLLHRSIARQKRYITKDPNEGTVCFQLSSSHPNNLALATKIVTDVGADLIDLNCGCPMKKIRKLGNGSALLSDAQKLYQLIRAMKQNTHVPVSIKIRVDGRSHEKNNADIVKVIQDAGPDFIIVHGRHWTEDYDCDIQYDQIAYFVEALTIPVIGNGDIKDKASLLRMLETGCAGVMISRAGVGAPWLIQQLIAEVQNNTFLPPDQSTVGRLLLEHVTGLMQLIDHEKYAILQARKFAKYYARNMLNKDVFVDAVNRCETFNDFEQLCLQYFK